MISLADFQPLSIAKINVFHLQPRFYRDISVKVHASLKWCYDKNCICPIQAILKHKQVVCMRRKMLFVIFKYLFSF